MGMDNIFKTVDSLGGIDGIINGAKGLKGIFKKDSSKTSESSQESGAYSDALEKFISLVIEDGEITDREMELLQKKAESEGIDPLEIEIVVKKRLKKRLEEKEFLKKPVNQIVQSFKLAEDCAKGGKSAGSASALSSALSLIEGVSGVASIGSLASSLIKTPSNLNLLKAEIINNIAIPENEQYISDFLLFAHSQKEFEINKKSSSGKSISGVLSKVTMGSELDLVPVWENKITILINTGRRLFGSSDLMQSTIKQVYTSPTDKLKKLKGINYAEFLNMLESMSAPDDSNELLELIEFLFAEREIEEATKLHKKLYAIAEKRFSDDPSNMATLKKYKIKKFGLF